jgi:response regulator RpfG family c-di-GMP phosphodiesterase
VRITSNDNGTDYWLRRSGTPRESLPCLLVVDDHELVARAVARALAARYKVFKAYNGKEAFALIDKNRFCVAIVDHDLPDVKGTEILRRLHERIPSTVRVLMSGRNIPGIDSLCSSGLVQHFLSKPLDLREIRDCTHQ